MPRVPESSSASAATRSILRRHIFVLPYRVCSRRQRRLILQASGAALALVADPLRAQRTGKLVRIGYLGNDGPETQEGRRMVDAFLSEMVRIGWVEGRRVVYEFRFASGVYERFGAQAQELVAAKVDLIVATSTRCAIAAKQTTSNIPVVFIAGDPIENGLIASLARPEGNLTGLASLADPLLAKRMQLLTQAVPGIARVAYLGVNETRTVQVVQATAKALKVELLLAHAQGPDDVARAIRSGARADAWLVDTYEIFNSQRTRIVELIAAQNQPAIYSQIPWVHAGGLMAFAASLEDMHRRAAGYVDRLLRGAKPADLPVEEPREFVLAVNLKTAHGLGIKLARSVMLQASEVIE